MKQNGMIVRLLFLLCLAGAACAGGVGIVRGQALGQAGSSAGQANESLATQSELLSSRQNCWSPLPEALTIALQQVGARSAVKSQPLLLPAPEPAGVVEPLLARRVTGVNATSDVNVDVRLDLGLRLSGTVSGPSFPLFGVVFAQAADGSAFSSPIDLFSGRYLIVLPGGTYNLRVCFFLINPLFVTQTAFDDPTPVVVSADTTRDITVPTVITHQVAGTISNLDPSFATQLLAFASADGKSGGSGTIMPGGTYQAPLPNGNYTVGLLESDMGGRTSMIVLGSVVVSDTDVMADFGVPPTPMISGMVSRVDMMGIPDGSSVIAVDVSAPPVMGGSCGAAVFNFGSGSIDPSSGRYQLVAATGSTYRVAASLPVIPVDPPQSIGTMTFPGPPDVLLVTDTIKDVAFPPVPGTVNITGLVTDPGVLGVANTFVTASTQEITGALGAFFSRSTQTGPNGMYQSTVLSGTNYTLDFVPPVPAP